MTRSPLPSETILRSSVSGAHASNDCCAQWSSGNERRGTITNSHPLISAIIPVYNGARYPGEALESVLGQTYRPIEIIIADDGSTDESACVVQRFPVRYCVQPHGGPGAARNRGVEQAGGEFLAFLDADDLWMRDKLASQIATFATQAEPDAVFGKDALDRRRAATQSGVK